MEKILVTGATGFVGSHLVSALLKEKYDVICAVTKKVDWLLAEQVVINPLELQEDWSDALSGVDVVIHLAARVHVMKETVTDPYDEFYKINSRATKILAEQAAKSGVKRFIYLSSIKVNGEFTAENMPFTEEHLPQPNDAYGHSKLKAEEYLLSIAKTSSRMDVVILRPPLIFGPGVRANFLKMLGLVNKGLPLPFGRINNTRHFVFIENLVSAIIAVINAPNAANQIYLVADNHGWSLSELLSYLAGQMGVKLNLFYVPGLHYIFKWPGFKNIGLRLFSSLEIDNNKLRTQLDWEPPFSSKEGLSKTVSWYKNEYNS